MTRTLSFRIAAALVAFLIVGPSIFAQGRRHAVGRVVSGVPATISGTVTDAATGAPVQLVFVNVGDLQVQTNPSGQFTVKVPAGRSYAFEFSRGGYQTATQNVTVTGDQSISVTIQPRPTVKVRTTAGDVVELDGETVTFGYVVPFTGYNKRPYLTLCHGGTPFELQQADMKRIVGPAVSMIDASCCVRPAMGVTVEMKNGETRQGIFVDACAEYTMEVIGLNHVNEVPTYIKLTNVSEVILP